MIPREGLGTTLLHFYVRILKALIEWNGLSLRLPKTGLTMNGPIFPSGRNRPLVLYKWGEGEIIAEGKEMHPRVMQ